MKKAEFPEWSNETEKIATEIYRVTSQIKSTSKKLKHRDISEESFRLFEENVYGTLDQWTGSTYVGVRKDKSVKKAFQAFFEELYRFLMDCRESDIDVLRGFAKKALYRGTLYRYLGHGSSTEDCDRKVDPEYDGVYVSWSKKTENSYFRSKLYGTITLITCEVTEPYYGIDLAPFKVGNRNEAEVVFPTIQELITDIHYEDR